MYFVRMTTDKVEHFELETLEELKAFYKRFYKLKTDRAILVKKHGEEIT